MRTWSRPIENGPSTTKIFVIRGHDGARSGPTPTLLGVVTVQRRTIMSGEIHKRKNGKEKKMSTNGLGYKFL